MQELLDSMIGKKVDVICSGASCVRGEIVRIQNGVMEMRDEDKICYIAIEKIAIVWEVNDNASRAGFMSGFNKI